MTHYEIARQFPDSPFGAEFLPRWREIMEKCLATKRAVSREWFLALHEIACEEAAHRAMEALR